MTEFLDILKTGYLKFAAEGQYIAIFLLALLLLWVKRIGTNHQEKKRTPLLAYTTAVFILVICPFSAWVLMKYQTAFYTYSQLFLWIPMTAVMGWAGVSIVEGVLFQVEKQDPKGRLNGGRKKWTEAAVLGALAILLALGGTVSLAAESTPKVENSSWVPEDVLEVFRALEEEELQGKLLLAPDEVLEYARAYSGEFSLLYGRNMWQKELNAYTYDTYAQVLEEVHAWLNPSGRQMLVPVPPVTGNEMKAVDALQAIEESDCKILVLKKAQYEDHLVRAALDEHGRFVLRIETEAYIVLQSVD